LAVKVKEEGTEDHLFVMPEGVEDEEALASELRARRAHRGFLPIPT
jgi:hypothetical protein